MTLQQFTRNFADNSTDAGYQFTFYCDICHTGFKTKFVESKTFMKRRLLKGLGKIAESASYFIPGAKNIGMGVGTATDSVSERFRRMSPKWHKEHEAAFKLAQNEAQSQFHCCQKCSKWVCENDWNKQEGLCVDDASRLTFEVATAKVQKAVKEIMAKAAQGFTGKIERRQPFCTQCGKPADEGKFCNNCGATIITLVNCAKCGTDSPSGTRFCGECGTKFG